MSTEGVAARRDEPMGIFPENESEPNQPDAAVDRAAGERLAALAPVLSATLRGGFPSAVLPDAVASAIANGWARYRRGKEDTFSLACIDAHYAAIRYASDARQHVLLSTSALDAVPDPEGQADQAMTDDVARALGELTDKQWRAFHLCDWCRLTLEQAAAELGIDRRRVHQHRRAALRKLRVLLAHYEPD